MDEKQRIQLSALRTQAAAERDPTTAEEALRLLIQTAQVLNAARILEIGTGRGLTGIALLLETQAELTTIEVDAARARIARENFARFSLTDRVRLHEGDAGEILPLLQGEYDLIFLDGPKVQYRRYFADCKRLLRRGGVLFSDDVLLYGWVRGDVAVPHKRRMLVEHIREYLAMLEGDPAFETQIYPYGEGLAVARKIL